MSFKDHFSTQAATYAKARPRYPAALFGELARLAPGRELAWDCGTGNGQAAVALAEHFARVVATEPSEAQLAAAVPHGRVTYINGAERVPAISAGTADIVTAAQAAHWFDLEAFYPEVRRVLRPGGLIALWSYGLCRITAEIDAIVDLFYSETVGPYWPPERRHPESGYRELSFPFEEIAFPEFSFETDWTAEEFAAYLRTWSAVARYAKAQGNDPVATLAPKLAHVWGRGRRRIRWPLGGRLGRVSAIR